MHMGMNDIDMDMAVEDRAGAISAALDLGWCEEFANSHAPDAVVLVDPDLRAVWGNAAAQRLLGYSMEEFTGGTEVVEFVYPEDLAHAVGALSEASREDGYHVATRLRLANIDGNYLTCRVVANTVPHDGCIWFVLGIRSADEEDAIESRRRRLRGLATTFYVDCASMEWADEPTHSTGLLGGLGAVLDAEAIEVAELVDQDHLRTVAAWIVGRPRRPDSVGLTQGTDGLDVLRSIPCEYTSGSGTHTARVWLESAKGVHGVVTIHLGDHPEQWDDANADIVSLMCASLLATVHRCETERAVARAATRDPLTGLLNRGAMMECLDELLNGERPNSEELDVFFADLNNFKALNDTEGHQAGDEVLKSVAAALRSGIRRGDLAARVGGDEFVVAMRTRRGSLERLTTRLRQRVESVIEPSTGVGVAIGAISVRDGETPSQVLERADMAMYADKRRRSGRDRRRQDSRGAQGPRLSAAMESLSIMLAVGADGRLLSATRAAYSVFGFEPESSESMDVLELVHPNDRALATVALSHTRDEAGVGEPIEIRVIDALGKCHAVHIEANNQLSNPDIRGIVLTLTEVARLRGVRCPWHRVAWVVGGPHPVAPAPRRRFGNVGGHRVPTWPINLRTAGYVAVPECCSPQGFSDKPPRACPKASLHNSGLPSTISSRSSTAKVLRSEMWSGSWSTSPTSSRCRY